MVPEVAITPYSLMKMRENPFLLPNKRLRRTIKRHLRDHWTSAKVARLKTAAIEEQLRAYGVQHSKERFLSLAANRFSAWSIADTWLAEDPVSFTDTKDEDFLGIAACELWKRYTPERPSTEMLDDWMQEGYQHLDDNNTSLACDIWWRVWQTLAPRFAPGMRTMQSVEPVFNGMQSVFNWSQGFEMHLHNASIKDVKYAELGREYCEQWLSQFTDEDASMQVNFRRALADFLFRLDRLKQGEAILIENIKRWPSEVWSYIALADACSDLFPSDTSLPVDLQRAQEILREGLAVTPQNAIDREVLEERLQELSERPV